VKIFNNVCRLAAASDEVYQLLAQGRWFSPGTPASSTTKTGRHDIAEILLKVALITNIQIQIQIHSIMYENSVVGVIVFPSSRVSSIFLIVICSDGVWYLLDLRIMVEKYLFWGQISECRTVFIYI
jgi:hypothetical protein